MDSEVEIIVKIVQRRRKESRSEREVFIFILKIYTVIYDIIRMTYDFKIYKIYIKFSLTDICKIYIFLRSGLN